MEQLAIQSMYYMRQFRDKRLALSSYYPITIIVKLGTEQRFCKRSGHTYICLIIGAVGFIMLLYVIVLYFSRRHNYRP